MEEIHRSLADYSLLVKKGKEMPVHPLITLNEQFKNELLLATQPLTPNAQMERPVLQTPLGSEMIQKLVPLKTRKVEEKKEY